MVNKSKEILKGKLGSAVVPANVTLGQQMEIFLEMLDDGKRNRLAGLIQYTESFGNECQNPFIIQNDKKLPKLPTYLSWGEFWDTFHEPSPQNIRRLVSRFRVKTIRRPEIINVHPDQEEQNALKVASKQATCYVYPPFLLSLDNVSPLHRKAKGCKVT